VDLSGSPVMYVQARKLLEQGLEDSARDIYLRGRSKKGQSAQDHAAWARIGEELDLLSQAREDWQRALSVTPHFCADYCIGLARLLIQLNEQPERIVRILQSVISKEPGRLEARSMLAQVYRSLGWNQAAQHLDQEKNQLVEKVGPRRFPRDLDQQTLDLFLKLFGGREVGYAEEIMNSETGAVNLVHKETPMGRGDVQEHLLGQRSLAWYPLRTDLTVSTITFMYHLKTAGLKDVGPRNRAEVLCNSAWEGFRYLSARGLPAVFEKCPPLSARIWLFLEGGCHFLMARRLSKLLVQKLPFPRSGVSLCPLLPTGPRGVKWEEQAHPMPLGVDRQSGKRRWFMDEKTKEPASDQLLFLHRIVCIQPKRLRQIVQKIEFGDDFGPLADLAQQSLDLLLSRCQVIKTIKDKAEAGRILSRKEKVAVFYTVGFLDQENVLLHRFLEPCPDYRYKAVTRQAKNIHSRPISCLKLRSLVPEITASVDCNCLFRPDQLSDGRYPSPLLHVNAMLVPTEDERLSIQRSTVKELGQHYLSISQEIYALEERRDILAKELTEGLSRKSRPWIKVDGSILSLENDGNIRISSK
jgi:hypothetical protein